MKTAPLEIMPSSSARLCALAPDYQPELKPGHVLCDQGLPVEDPIEKAKVDSIAKLNRVMPSAKEGDPKSQIEFAKESKLLTWLCSDSAKGWVEEKYPWRDAIFGKYQFKELEDGFVSFTLPKGTSYLDLFEEANRHCKENGRSLVAVSDWVMDWFAQRADATGKIGRSQTHEIQGLVAGSTDKTRSEQESLLRSKGLSFASLEAAAAAAALYYCATGNDLLDGKYARTAAPGLGLDSYAGGAGGLDVDRDGYDDRRYDLVGAAGVRNLET